MKTAQTFAIPTLSTGAKTKEGKEKVSKKALKHCKYTAENGADIEAFREFLRQTRELLARYGK